MPRVKLSYEEKDPDPNLQSITEVPDNIDVGHKIKQFDSTGHWVLHEVMDLIHITGGKHGEPKMELVLIYVDEREDKKEETKNEEQ